MKILSSDIPRLLESSFVNFLVPGVDAARLKEDPDHLVTAFLVRPEHELWRNSISNNGNFNPPLTSFPSPIDISARLGSVALVVPRQVGCCLTLDEYRMEEKQFVKTGITEEFTLMSEPVSRMTTIPAGQLTTLYVPRGEPAFWLVYSPPQKPNDMVYTRRRIDQVAAAAAQPMPDLQFRLMLRMLEIDVLDAA